MLLKQSFYNQSTLKVARELLGCFLIRRINGQTLKTMIVETEAYVGFSDKASHASRGQTERNAVMFGPAGCIYVYLVYGMHHMLNIVTEEDKYPAAVLIRALDPLETGLKNTNGPAKLTKALRIDRKFNHSSIFTKKHDLWIESARNLKPSRVVKRPRVGVDYAGDYKDKLWRFYVKGNEWISRK